MGIVNNIQKNLGMVDTKNGFQGEEIFNTVDLNKSSTYSLVQNVLKGLQVAPADGDFRSFAQTYATVVWVYVAAWIISSSIASAPLKLYRRKKGNDEEIKDTDNPINDLLMNPNIDESGNELIEDLVLYLETTGNGYWEKYGSVGNLPISLFNLQPYFMNIVPGSMRKVDKYIFDIGGKGSKKTFYPKQICHFKYANPNSIYYGQGAIKALCTSLVTELHRETYNKNFFENEARPDMIIKHNPDITKGISVLSKEAKKSFIANWKRKFSGSKNTHTPLLLEAGMDVDILTEARRDMDFREMEKSLRERIFGAYGVPPAMAGIYEYANYANAKEQIKIFWTTTLPPKCKRIENAIYRNVIRPYDKDLYCRFDMDFVPALEETIKEKEERLSRQLERGGITLGEYARALGHPMEGTDEKEFGSKRVIASNLIPLEDAFMRMDGEEEIPKGPLEETSPAFQPGN